MYVALAGGPPSARRAAWMVAAWGLARASSYRPDSVGALSFTFAIMLAGTPHQILDPSVQLSFGAVTAVIMGYRAGQAWLKQLTMNWSFRSLAKVAHVIGGSLWVSCLCALGSLPAALFHFDTFAPIGLVVNVIAIPITAYGIVVPGMLWFAWSVFSSAPNLLDQWVSKWLHQAITVLLDINIHAASRPWRSTETMLTLTLCITAISAYYLVLYRGRRVAKIALLATLICAYMTPYTAILSDSASPQNEPIHLTFLDVGHGDCIIIHRTDGHAILIDTGGDPSGVKEPGRRVVIPALRALGIRHIDAIILSHAHPDHYQGLSDILQCFPIAAVWYNGQAPEDPAWGSILERLATAQTPVHVAEEIIPLPPRWAELTFSVLPRPSQTGIRDDWSANDNSLVLLMRFHSFSALFTGDIEKEAERFLLPYLEPVDVLKVAHHGSATSSSSAFLHRVRPRLAIAQSDDGGRYNLPHPDIEQRYAQHKIPFWTTGRCGAVQLHTDGSVVSIIPYAPPEYLRRYCRP